MASYDEWIKEASKPGHVSVIIGRRGSGKSALGYKIAEDVNNDSDSDVYILGLPDESQELLPDSFKVVEQLTDVPNGSHVLIDEAAIHFAAADWHKKGHKELSKLISIARHKNLSLVFITLNTASINVRVLRYVDSILFKPLSLLQMELERQQVKKIIKEAKEAFDKLEDEKDDINPLKYVYLISGSNQGMMTNDLPSFWTDKLSVSYKSFDLDDDKNQTEVLVLGGGQPGNAGGDWACSSCKYWTEDDEEGWCTIGMTNVPRKECRNHKEVKQKPTKILNKNVTVERNPKINIVNWDGLYDKIPKKKKGNEPNDFLDDIIDAVPNPPKLGPSDDDFCRYCDEKIDEIILKSDCRDDELQQLNDEIKYNTPYEYNSDFLDLHQGLKQLRRYDKNFPIKMNPIPSAKFNCGDYLRLKDRVIIRPEWYDHKLCWALSEHPVKYHGDFETLSSGKTERYYLPKGVIVQLVELEQLGDETVFSILVPENIFNEKNWIKYRRLLNGSFEFFEKVSEDDVKMFNYSYWENYLDGIETIEDFNTLLEDLNYARNNLYLYNLGFKYIKDGTPSHPIPDPAVEDDKLTVYHISNHKLLKESLTLKELKECVYFGFKDVEN